MFNARLLTITGVHYSQNFKTMAIVLCRTANEYFQYLFESWDCPRIKFARNAQQQMAWRPMISISGTYGTHFFFQGRLMTEDRALLYGAGILVPG